MSEGNNRGRFIVLEGVDGSGITTQAARLAQWLEEKSGRKVLLTKEPSEGPVGLLLRQALTKRLQGFSTEVLALLFAADRLDHISQSIMPALEQGNDVVCDRYVWSTLAYQGRHLSRDWLIELNSKALRPDLTIFIRVEPEVTLQRIKKNRFQVDLFEQEAILREVLKKFDFLVQAALAQGEKVLVVDGAQAMDDVTTEILNRFNKI